VVCFRCLDVSQWIRPFMLSVVSDNSEGYRFRDSLEI
jgi:hypothetical protein